MKLKTLKDLTDYSADPHINLVDREQLKQEAIKWVKKAEIKENKCLDELDFTKAAFQAGLKTGLTIFHNIAEDDLKQYKNGK